MPPKPDLRDRALWTLRISSSRFSPWINPMASSPQPVRLYTCASLPLLYRTLGCPFPQPLASVSPAPLRTAALPCYPLTYSTQLLSHGLPLLPGFLNGSTSPSLTLCTAASVPGWSPPSCWPRVAPWLHLHSLSRLSGGPLTVPYPIIPCSQPEAFTLCTQITPTLQSHCRAPSRSRPVPCTGHGQHFGSEAGSGESCWSGQVWVVTSCV